MIGLVIATKAEAEPIISALKLKRASTKLPCYLQHDTRLVISGIGRNNVATACGWLAAAQVVNTEPTPVSCWLNIGIAGHKTAERGTLMAIHKATDQTSDKVWFPHRIFTQIGSSDLITVDKPLVEYLPDHCHDMEGSAFFEAARRFADAELVQSLKIVSDNDQHPVEQVNAALATRLVRDQIDAIIDCTCELKALAESITQAPDAILEPIIERWHFTTSQVVQLERLLQKYRVLHKPLTVIPDELQPLKSSRQVLGWFQDSVATVNYLQ